MGVVEISLAVLGLCVFEVVSSLDNAVVNADVLSTMEKRWRRWFMVWGILTSVFLVRGLLPWVIVWAVTPDLGFIEAFTVSFSGDARAAESINIAKPHLLLGGGIFMLFLFLHWLFLEPKTFGLKVEKFFSRQGVWFFALASILLTWFIWLTLHKETTLALAAAVGSSAFFIIHGFKDYAERMESQLTQSSMSQISKLMYLEVLDTTFSIDGVVGAFAFTMSVPLILLGNGIGAIVVRELTIRGVDKIRNYVFLKNGAMYSIGFLGTIMVAEAFGYHVPHYIAPVITVGLVGFAFYKSKKQLARA